MNTEQINSFIESQLNSWPLARDNFFRLMEAERKPMKLGDLHACVQLNPARIVSTGAAVDKRSIEARPCFLCADNRPAEQVSFPWLEGWEFLVNPYPILPVHFTIPSCIHEPQAKIPLEMAAMAEKAPSLAFFFNGAHAGASAPDHLHLQAVLKEELPLLRLAEENHPADAGGFMTSEMFGRDLPFQFISALITPDLEGMQTLSKIPSIFGIDPETGEKDPRLVNAYFWIGNDGLLRSIVVPRRRHRPSCYFLPEGERLLISPGAIDMAGLIISPRKEDYERLDAETIRKIYAEVAFPDHLPQTLTTLL